MSARAISSDPIYRIGRPQQTEVTPVADDDDPRSKARKALLELIAETAEKIRGEGNATTMSGAALALAEAYAWAVNPNQDHG